MMLLALSVWDLALHPCDMKSKLCCIHYTDNVNYSKRTLVACNHAPDEGDGCELKLKLQALVLKRDAKTSAESYCVQSAEQLFLAHGPSEEDFWKGAGQPELSQRKVFVKQVIHQLLEVGLVQQGAACSPHPPLLEGMIALKDPTFHSSQREGWAI